MRRRFFIIALALGAAAEPAGAQSLAQRIASAPGTRVQFTFAARPDVCGNGRSFIQMTGEWYGSWSDGDRREACAPGPVRVVLDRAERDGVVSVATYVGPVSESPAGTTDLGRVGVATAVDYLLGLAERAQGRVSRDAILPAMLADSVDQTSGLLAVARNQNGSRETRRTAVSWLARPAVARERSLRDVSDALIGIAKDDDDNNSVRQAALRALARLEHGAGMSALMTLAGDADRAWLSREALSALAGSGDPRARDYLRGFVSRAEAPDEVLAAAIRGFGGEYATGADIKLVRDTYARLPGDRSREVAINAIATFGGGENVRWLQALASNADVPLRERRRAISMLSRSSDERVKKFLSELADR